MAIRKIVARSIGVDVIVAEDLADNSITAAEITNGAVTADKLASNSVTTAKIAAGVTLTSPVMNTITSAAATALTLQSAGTTAITVDTSQNVGIGNTTPSSFDPTGKPLVVGSGSGNQGITIYAGTTGYSTVNFADGTTGSDRYAGQVSYDHTNNALLFATTTGIERMRIDSNGTLLIGTTNTDPTFNRVNGLNLLAQGRLYSRANGSWDIGRDVTSGSHMTFYTDNGSARVAAGSISSNGGTTSYNTTSDYRMKENIAPMAGALTIIQALKPITYDWKEEFVGTKKSSQGFIAHELAEVVPDCVTGEKDAVDDEGKPKYQGIDTSFLVATLTAAIQELKAENDTLKQRLDAAGL